VSRDAGTSGRTLAPRKPIVTELGLIVGIDVVGLVLALLLWRDVSVRDAGPPAIRRLGSALERAVRAFLWQEYRLIALATLGLVVLAAGAGMRLDGGDGLGRFEGVFWTAAGLCLGAFGASLSGHAATVLAVRGSSRAAAAAVNGVNGALGVSMRATGAATLLAETLSVLGNGCLFGLLYAIKGGFALPSAQALPLAARAVALLPSFALGASLAALVMQRGGGTFHAASGVGSDQTGEREAGLDHDDARNPAVIAELVGDHVGASATRIVDGFASSSVANCAALLIGVALAAATSAREPLLLPALPLVLRAFGVLASAFGIFLVRSDEESSLSLAFMRGYLSSAVIALVGVAGTTFWLFGENFLAVFASGALGLIAALLAAHASSLQLGRRTSAQRDTNEGLRVGTGAVVAAGLGVGLESALLPISVFGVAALGVARLGAESSLAGGASICALVFVLAALSLAPFVTAIAALGSVADGARGIASLSNAQPELRRRSARLDDASFAGGSVARRYAILGGTLSTLLIAWALIEGVRGNDALATGVSEGAVLVWCGALGAAVALGYAGSVVRAAVRGAREVSAEVERQLRGFPREHGSAQIPADYTPSYKSCVDLLTTGSLRQALTPIALALLAPVGLGVLLRVFARESASALVSRGLMAFVVVAALTALACALCLDAARAAVAGLRRESRTKDSTGAATTSLSADSWSDIFGNAAAPALSLLVKTTAAAALVVTHFLS